MLYELRQYRTFPGRRDEFARLMEAEIIPFQVACGMDVVATFLGTDDDDLFVWVRRFADEDDRRRLYAAVYESDRWRDEFDPRVRELLDFPRIRVTPLAPALGWTA